MGESKESVVDRHCEGCKYLSAINHELRYCAYLFNTDKRRPCPAGKGCTAKKKGKPRKVFWGDNG